MGKDAAVHQLQQKEQQRRVSRSELLKPKITEEDVYIKRLDGTVKLRSLSQEKRRIIREGCGANTPDYSQDKFELLSIVHSVVDPKLNENDVEELKEQDGGIIDELVVAIQMLNTFGNIEQLKNSLSEIQSSDSPSTSQKD